MNADLHFCDVTYHLTNMFLTASASEDFDLLCPDKADTSAKPPLPVKRSATSATTPNTAKKYRQLLLPDNIVQVHADADRIARVNASIVEETEFVEETEADRETLRQATSKLLDVVNCTSEFGMGIDIPHIDCAIHVVPPPALSEYAQQIGRAGRSGAGNMRSIH